MCSTNSDWWTAFGALAQAAGAFATFAAVGVSLWIVLSERALRARGRAAIMTIFQGDGTPGIHVVDFIVENVGVRDFSVQSISWRIGWLPIGPMSLRFRYAIQTSRTGQIFENRKIQISLSEHFYVSVAEMKIGMTAEGERAAFFSRKVPIFGWAPMRAYANIAGRRPLRLKLEKNLLAFLRTGQHSNTTADVDESLKLPA